jgi:hypothetical protein
MSWLGFQVTPAMPWFGSNPLVFLAILPVLCLMKSLLPCMCGREEEERDEEENVRVREMGKKMKR